MTLLRCIGISGEAKVTISFTMIVCNIRALQIVSCHGFILLSKIMLSSARTHS